MTILRFFLFSPTMFLFLRLLLLQCQAPLQNAAVDVFDKHPFLRHPKSEIHRPCT